MNRLRLIESFTWMMLNTQWYLLEVLYENKSIEILKSIQFNELSKYLTLVSDNQNGMLEEINYIDTLDSLMNMDFKKQLKLNEQILSDYTEKDLLKLLKSTVELLECINKDIN